MIMVGRFKIEWIKTQNTRVLDVGGSQATSALWTPELRRCLCLRPSDV